MAASLPSIGRLRSAGASKSTGGGHLRAQVRTPCAATNREPRLEYPPHHLVRGGIHSADRLGKLLSGEPVKEADCEIHEANDLEDEA